MDLISATIGLALGSVASIVASRLNGRRKIERYAEESIMNQNFELTGRVRDLEKALDECKTQSALQNAKIVSLAAAIRMLKDWLEKQGFKGIPDLEKLLNGNGL